MVGENETYTEMTQGISQDITGPGTAKKGKYFENIVFTDEVILPSHITAVQYKMSDDEISRITVQYPANDVVAFVSVPGADQLVVTGQSEIDGLAEVAVNGREVTFISIGSDYSLKHQFVETPSGVGLLVKTESPTRRPRPRITRNPLSYTRKILTEDLGNRMVARIRHNANRKESYSHENGGKSK